MNSIYEQFNQNNGNQNILQAFMEFKKNYKGDAKTDVMKLIASGVNQNQLNQIQNMAMQLQKMLHS